MKDARVPRRCLKPDLIEYLEGRKHPKRSSWEAVFWQNQLQEGLLELDGELRQGEGNIGWEGIFWDLGEQDGGWESALLVYGWW